MAIKSLEISCWIDENLDEKTIENPSWDAIEKSIAALDGQNCDGIILNGEESAYMGVAGGLNRKYVVAGRLSDAKRFILTSGKPFERWERLPVGGQENEYANYELVSLDLALRAARTFFEHGKCDPSLTWNERAAKLAHSHNGRTDQ